METLFLLRHGETAWNRGSRVMGRLGIPLNQRGREQARRAARLLAGLNIRAIYTSPLKRALETALILVAKTHLPVNIDPNLTELAFGRWEGCRPEDLVRDRAYHRFIKAPSTVAMPGGETLLDVQKRGLRAMRLARRQYPGGRLLFVTHADVIRAVLCHYLRLPLEEFRRLRIDNASLTALEIDGDWAEIKFINYVTDITRMSKESYEGLKPTLLRKSKGPKPAVHR